MLLKTQVLVLANPVHGLASTPEPGEETTPSLVSSAADLLVPFHLLFLRPRPGVKVARLDNECGGARPVEMEVVRES